MHHIGRRIFTAGLAGATLALAGLPRKLWAQTIVTPQPEPEPELRSIMSMKLTQPAVPVASQPFTDEAGKDIAIADYVGKGVVLNLWATWCVPCVAEMPALDRLAGQLAAEGIVVLALSSDRGGAATVKRFYANHKVANLGIYLDKFGAAARGWGARGLPTTLIIDRHGNERARLEGGIAWDTPEALTAIRKLVG
jgi:thiol-disulfide isomerase/thioredoxin